jgi:predicted permease
MFWRRKRSVNDFQEEIRTHLELEVEALKQEGLSEREAHLAAKKAFGNVLGAEERFYEKNRLRWLDEFSQDLRHGLRMMRKAPGFTAAVVATLALGMGANTAIFSLIDAVLLRSLPVQAPEQLVFLAATGSKGRGPAPPYPCFERFQKQTNSYSGMAAFANSDVGIRLEGPIEQVDAARVSGDYFQVLGIKPAAGRLLTPEDAKLDPPVAVISYDYWQRRFGGNPSAIGHTFKWDGVMGGRLFTIVGVTAPGFHGLLPGRVDDITLPIAVNDKMLKYTDSWWFSAVARMKPGVNPEVARQETDRIFQSFMEEFPVPDEVRRNFFHHMELAPASQGLDELRRRFSKPLWALMTVVGLVLLIACANITNLLLARSAQRAREFALRVAIGAGRGRLFRQLLTETGLLFAAGAAAGLLVAWWAVRGLTSFFAGGARPIQLEVHWDWRVLGFTVGASLLASLLFGAAPMLNALRSDPNSAMKDGGRSTMSRGGGRLGQVLVAFQVALSLILLVGATLFLRTLQNLHRQDLGFNVGRVALVGVHLPHDSYPEVENRTALWDRLLPEVRSLPGVEAAALSSMTPLDGNGRGVAFDAPGFQSESREAHSIGLITASESYFQTLGIALLRGRDFTDRDRTGTPYVGLINESARKHFFGDKDPIGTDVVMNKRTLRIIGVVADVMQEDLRRPPRRFLYISIRQPMDMGARQTLSIRTAGDPEAVLPAVLSRLRSLGPDVHLLRSGTLARQMDESLMQERLISTLATAFGLLALVLSAVGLYGVLSYSVARKTPEIGVRMALGAMPGQVAWSILRRTMAVIALGLAVGIPVSVLVSHAAESMLFGVTPADGLSQLIAAALLGLVAMAAGYLPARRAGRVDPVTALRHE